MTVPQIDVVCNLMMSASREEFYDQILANRALCRGPQDVVQAVSRRGKSVAICGAGPSLATAAEQIAGGHYDEVWGCNRARNWLYDNHYPVTHGFAIDQGLDMLKPVEWRRVLPVDYYLASSVHPLLAKRIHRRGMRITWFHNYLGMPNPEGWVDPPDWHKPPDVDGTMYSGKELWLYCTKWPSTVQTGYGLNAVPRAICMALFMGFDRIDVYGADCAAASGGAPMPPMDDPGYPAWLGTIALYAGGQSVLETYGPNAIMAQTELEGQRWHTRPDMIISARHLADLVRAFDGHNEQFGVKSTVRLVGDSFAAAVSRQGPEYFARMPNLNGKGGVEGFQVHPDVQRRILEQETGQPQRS